MDDVDDEPGPCSIGLVAGVGDDGTCELRGRVDCEGIMSISGSSPITALGARSGRTLRCEDRDEPAGAPSDGTVDSVAAAGWSIAGSDDNARGATAEPALAAGSVTTALGPEPEPQFVQGAGAAAGML
jgi:hypothetical protein